MRLIRGWTGTGRSLRRLIIRLPDWRGTDPAPEPIVQVDGRVENQPTNRGCTIAGSPRCYLQFDAKDLLDQAKWCAIRTGSGAAPKFPQAKWLDLAAASGRRAPSRGLTGYTKSRRTTFGGRIALAGRPAPS